MKFTVKLKTGKYYLIDTPEMLSVYAMRDWAWKCAEHIAELYGSEIDEVEVYDPDMFDTPKDV